MRTSLGAAAICLATAALALAYAPFERTAGVTLFRDDADRILYFVDPSTAAGLQNSKGETVISAESSPLAAIVSAMRRWTDLPYSSVRFEPPRFGGLGLGFDGTNLITFADTPMTRSVTSGAIAVTRLFSNSDGRLTDTDITFSPDFPFSTVGEEDAFDVESVLAHELGHALGMDHSGVATASLFATTVRGATNKRALSQDEAAYAADFYPDASAFGALGEIRGRVPSDNGAAVRGAAVAVVDPTANFVAATLSERDGTFRIAGLPPGEYRLYAEPLDGPAEPFQLSSPRGASELNFLTAFADGPVTVQAGQASIADVAVMRGTPMLNARGFGAHAPGEELQTRFGAIVERGGVYEAEAFGERLDEVAESEIRFLGTGVTVRTGTRRTIGTIRFGDGPRYPLIGFEIRVAPNAPLGTTTATFGLEGETSVVTGALRIVERRGDIDLQAAVNAAGFGPGPIAPGQIVSLFGEEIGPLAAASGAFDPLTGRLTPLAGDVSVLFSGRPGAIFYASRNQINVQAPPDLSLGATAIETVRGGRRSAPLTTLVASAAPAVFLLSGSTQAAALNLDGGVNGAGRPATGGEPLILFANGQGALNPPLATGEPGGVNPLSRAAAEVRVFVGGVEATVDFAGAAPGLAGVLQINLRTAPGTPTGDAVPVRVEVGGVLSPPGATVAIR